jgi:hypothetical protein
MEGSHTGYAENHAQTPSFMLSRVDVFYIATIVERQRAATDMRGRGASVFAQESAAKRSGARKQRGRPQGGPSSQLRTE